MPSESWFVPTRQAPDASAESTTTGGRERRRYGRRLIPAPYVRWAPNAVALVRRIGRLPIMVRDVSLESMRFQACVPMCAGSEFELETAVGDRQVRMPCRVTYSGLVGESPGERIYTHGCCFITLRPGDAQALAACGWK